MNNLVSIIMPLYNAELYLQESLKSIAQQTYSNWQLVVVDDGSTDNSMEIYYAFAKQNPNKCLLVRSLRKQSGAGVCRNIGLKKSSGELIIFCDSDDILNVFCLQQRVYAFKDNDMVIFKQYYLDPNTKKVNGFFTGKAENRRDAIEAFIKMDAPWQTMAPIWRKTTLEKLHGFDEALVYMEDPDLHLRALLDDNIKIKFEYCLPADNYYRINNMNVAKKILFYDNSIKSRIYFIKKYLFLSTISNTIYRKNIRKGYLVFLQNFVLARIQLYSTEIFELTNELKLAKVLNTIDSMILKVIFKIFLSKSYLIKTLRIKGIVFKLFNCMNYSVFFK